MTHKAHTVHTTDVAMHMMMCTHTDTCTTCAMHGVAVVLVIVVALLWCGMCAMLHDMNDDDAGVVYCLDGKMCCDVVMVWGHTSFAGCKCRV